MWIAIIFFYSTAYGPRSGGRAMISQEFKDQKSCEQAKHVLETASYYEYDKVVVHCVKK